MLVCPQCQFENPNTNKFCQRCGTSLTHKTCQECDAQVPLNAETCPNCGALTGTVWWAILARDQDLQSATVGAQALSLEASEQVVSTAVALEESKELSSPLESDLPTPDKPSEVSSTSKSDVSPLDEQEDRLQIGSPVELTSTAEDLSLAEDVTSPQFEPLPSKSIDSNDENKSDRDSLDRNPSVTSTIVYIDPQQRYQLLEPQNLEKAFAGLDSTYGASMRVLDCQPFQKSPLEALMEQKQGNSHTLESPGKPDTMNCFSTIPSDSWKVLGIPAIAQPYLALREAYYPTVPDVHDAWQQDGKAVVLLEDRSEWPLLSDLWGSEQLSTLQILYWLDEMAKLWEALEPWHCRQSLLEVRNLRVDEDQALGLVRLYPETQEQQLTLQDLGRMWQMLFDQSQRTQFTTLGAIFRQMSTNEIDTVQKLRSQLEALAHQQQSLTIAMAQSDDLAEETPAEDVTTTIAMKSALQDINSPNESEDLPTVILPMQLLSLDDAGCTDIGHQREHNEDSFGIQTQIKKQETPISRSVQARGLYILCDGMGGHAAGEVASAMAVETLRRYFQDHWQDDQLPTEDTIREAIRYANQAIYDVNQKNARSGSGRMGTTLAMILIQNTDAAIAHVGDSRIYRLTRKRGLEQITADHEVGQREIQRGVDPAIAYGRPDAYQLTQAIGPRGEQFINPDLEFFELNEDTLFVLCSDGLSDNDLIETHWQTHLAPLLSSRANLDQGILQLIELANEHNGHDNITAILVRVKVRPNFEQQQLL
ncbi:MAG TPA: serine/threonine phosphatase [Allocoleopsis sp.]